MMDATHLRALGPLLYKIACAPEPQWNDPVVAADLDERQFAPVDELPIPCMVRIGGAWHRYEGTRGDVMVLFSEGCAAESYYPVGDGETFGWRSLR